MATEKQEIKPIDLLIVTCGVGALYTWSAAPRDHYSVAFFVWLSLFALLLSAKIAVWAMLRSRLKYEQERLQRALLGNSLQQMQIAAHEARMEKKRADLRLLIDSQIGDDEFSLVAARLEVEDLEFTRQVLIDTQKRTGWSDPAVFAKTEHVLNLWRKNVAELEAKLRDAQARPKVNAAP